jgi:micrococcal nuclease
VALRAVSWRIVVAGLLVGPALASPAWGVTLTGTVSTVVDGDTIKVVSRGFETPVRLIGIDTPETRKPGTPVQCWGPEATARTKRLLPAGRRVRLVTDPTQDTRDRYGRLLAYVYRDGARTSVNRSLVLTGHAKLYVYRPSGPFLHVGSFRRAEVQARRARRGLWGPPCNGNTTKPAPQGRRPASSTPPAPPSGCDPNYRGACVPPAPPDLDCADIGRRVQVVGSDPHRLDGDGDGWGCERYG